MHFVDVIRFGSVWANDRVESRLALRSRVFFPHYSLLGRRTLSAHFPHTLHALSAPSLHTLRALAAHSPHFSHTLRSQDVAPRTMTLIQAEVGV